MANIYQSFFNWSEDEKLFWKSFIGTSAVFGLMIGSLLGGRLIVGGRRRTTLFTQSMAIVGSIFTCFKSVPLICIGRFILGFVGSCAALIMGKSICETLPQNKIS